MQAKTTATPAVKVMIWTLNPKSKAEAAAVRRQAIAMQVRKKPDENISPISKRIASKAHACHVLSPKSATSVMFLVTADAAFLTTPRAARSTAA